MSISESEQYDLLDRLAEEFADRFRRGERPALKEYTDRYPELADDIHELFPAMVRVEQAEGARQGEEERPGIAGRRTHPWADRRLPDPPRDRPGRHGGGLRGRADLAGPPRGAEGPAGARVRRPDGPGAVPPRGPRRGPAAPHQHRAGLRGGPGRRRPLLRHAVHPGPGARPGHRRAAAAPRPGRVRAQDQGGLRGPIAPAATRALSTGHRGRDTRRRRRGHRGRAVHPDRSVRPGRPGPGAGWEPHHRCRPGPSPWLGEDRDRAAGSTATRTEAGVVRGDAAGPSGVAVPACRRIPSSSSAILPGGTQLSSVESGRRAFFRSLAQIGRQVAAASPTPTRAGSSTATSSRRTCCSTPRASSGSPTSAWPRGTTRG